MPHGSHRVAAVGTWGGNVRPTQDRIVRRFVPSANLSILDTSLPDANQ